MSNPCLYMYACSRSLVAAWRDQSFGQQYIKLDRSLLLDLTSLHMCTLSTGSCRLPSSFFRILDMTWESSNMPAYAMRPAEVPRAVKPRGGTAHSDSCIGTLLVHTLFWLFDVAMHLTAGVLQVRSPWSVCHELVTWLGHLPLTEPSNA
jgi:hypothetical protein